MEFIIHEGPPATATPAYDAASRVALRYGPLKPLLRLRQPVRGSTVEAGYTF